MTPKKAVHKKKAVEDKRIYVIVPETVQVVRKRGERPVTLRMEAGRLMAQVGHVVTRFRLEPHNQVWLGKKAITTIVLSVRNTRELEKVYAELPEPTWTFHDDNLGFYGVKDPIFTAICTGVVTEDNDGAISDAIGHLELYKERK